MNGIIVLNKPKGITSHDVVYRVRKKFNIKKVGHAGTLDPLATGVLVLLLGKSTKLSNEFIDFDKAYSSTLLLGTDTDSSDTLGEIISSKPFDNITETQVEDALLKFKGEINQVPPMFSAVKIKGKKLYEWARKGIDVDRPSRKVFIKQIFIQDFQLPYVRFYLECSKGTYVRQLAKDIGIALECGACISQIERVRVGPFKIEDAVNIDQLNETHILNWKEEGNCCEKNFC